MNLVTIPFFYLLVQNPHVYQEALSTFDITLQILIIILGFIFSAIFSGSEVALFSLANQHDSLDQRESAGSVDQLLIRMLERPRRLLATILIGNTVANIVSSVLAAVLTGYVASFLGLSEVAIFSIEIVVLTFTLLILSEITPKVIAINNPIKTARFLGRFIYAFFILLKPLAKLIADSTVILEKKLPRPSSNMTSEDIMTIAEVSEQEGSIRSDEREIIENIIESGTTKVHEIMTSRTDIIAISTSQSLEDIVSIIREKGLSRMPLHENDIDNILGVIHSKDLLPYIHSNIERTVINWRTIARKALFIPATKKLDDLLRNFQQEKTHIAIVVDEYGGTEGIITLDDVLEEMIGDISDEYAEDEEKLFTKFKTGVYLFDAKIDLDDMEEVLDIEITDPDDNFETLGGLIYYLTERIPKVGEQAYYKGLQFTIHSVQKNRIRKIKVKINHKEQKSLHSQNNKDI